MSITDDQLAAEDKWLAAWKAGPQRLRWDHIPLQVGDPAPDLMLLSSAGDEVALSSLWAAGPALLLFWRHYGCSCGIDRAARLRDEYQSFVDAGASVVIIGQGGPERSAAYAERNGIPCPILSDQEQSSYRAYDLLEGTTAQILFDAPDEFLRCELGAGESLAASRHDTDRALVDNPWQLPGEFVIGGDGTVSLAYRYQFCEDFPDPRVLLAAIRFGAAAGA